MEPESPKAGAVESTASNAPTGDVQDTVKALRDIAAILDGSGDTSPKRDRADILRDVMIASAQELRELAERMAAAARPDVEARTAAYMERLEREARWGRWFVSVAAAPAFAESAPGSHNYWNFRLAVPRDVQAQWDARGEIAFSPEILDALVDAHEGAEAEAEGRQAWEEQFNERP